MPATCLFKTLQPLLKIEISADYDLPSLIASYWSYTFKDQLFYTFISIQIV